MQLRHLKTFVAVATTLNFTRAAEQVHLAQSSVTEQVQALEADLDVVLFDRSRRGLQLTSAGQRLLERADELLRLADETRASVKNVAGSVSGKLTIGGLETLCAKRLPGLLADFGMRYPDVELVLRTASSGQLKADVKRGALDVCFVFGDGPLPPELASEQVAEERVAVIVPAGHRLADQATVDYAELADESFLVTESGCVYRAMFETFAATLARRPRIVGEVASIAAILELVGAGMGCALVPRLVVPAASGKITALPSMVPDVVTPLTMAWRRQRVQSPALRTFIAAARDAWVTA
ncbi:MAG TPA: LysR family transcriptional regulator [Luteibacter sp.]|jgi:DNA-binding transcriptional LysR family regulator|nr:LysR family transcriptional regulator [Luteibacter sp.]